jgi:hypothetical protein
MSRKPNPAAKFAVEAVDVLVKLMRDSTSDAVRVAAARELLDRAQGKARAETAGAGGPTLQEMIRAAFEREDP